MYLLLLLWLLLEMSLILVLLLLPEPPIMWLTNSTGVQIMDAHTYHLLPFINKLR
jgi:hypothetical protein